MENYQIYQYYPMGYSAPTFNYFYCPPIMFIHPTDHLFPFTSCNTTLRIQATPLKSPPSPQRQHSTCKTWEKNEEKGETKDQQDGKGKERIISKSIPQNMQYITVSNRNILPNNLNLLLSYIRRINKSGKIVTKIIQQLTQDQNYTAKKFYSYQAYVKENAPFHKTKHTIQEITEYIDSNQRIFSREEQMFYNKVCRILLKLFLRGDYITTLLTSTKIHKTSKKQHLKIRRYLQLKLQKSRMEDMECYRLIEG